MSISGISSFQANAYYQQTTTSQTVRTNQPAPPGPGAPDNAGGIAQNQPRRQDVRVDAALDAVATALDLTPDQLRTKLGPGASLTQVADQNGMSAAALKSTVTKALTGSGLSANDAATLATKVIAGPPRPDQDTGARKVFALGQSGQLAAMALQQVPQPPPAQPGSSVAQLVSARYADATRVNEITSSWAA